MRFEKSEQLIKLALRMQAHTEGLTLQDIMRECEVGRRTAERMRDVLLILFPQMQEHRRENNVKYWRLPAGSLSGLIHIEAEDLADFSMAVEMLKRENLHHHAQHLEQFMLKVKCKMRPETVRSVETDLEALLEAEGHAMRPGPRPHIDPQVLYCLRESVKSCQKVRITYHGRVKSDVSHRVIHPYGFLYGWRHYVLAYCEKAQAMRSFSMPSIAEITLLNESYTKDSDFDMKAYVARSFGVFYEEPYEVVWRFARCVAEAAKAQHFHPTQVFEDEPDGSVLLKFFAGGTKEMCWHAMTWEGNVEIVAPQHLRDAYANMVQTLVSKLERL